MTPGQLISPRVLLGLWTAPHKEDSRIPAKAILGLVQILLSQFSLDTEQHFGSFIE
jgi:hypothetical protein